MKKQRKQRTKRVVLAEGETTGHAHVIDKGAEVLEHLENGEIRFSNPRPVQLTHEEHRTQTIPAGTYRTARVQETDHAANAVRNIAD